MKLIKSLHLLVIIALLALTACTSNERVSPYSQFSKAGIQVLSTSNPHHGPNVLIAHTLEESPRLASYFNHTGAPRAIEVRRANSFAEELLFYYPQDHRVYVAKKSRGAFERGQQHDWMIAGPYGIGKHDYRRIQNFSNPHETPVFLVNGAVTRYTTNPQMQRVQMQSGKMQRVMTLEPDIPLIPRPKPKPKPKPIVKKKPDPELTKMAGKPAKKVTTKLPNLDDPKYIPKNTDQEALMLSQGYAKRATNGDILHSIEGNAQMLANIAHWYMGSKNLVPELQEANQFSENQTDARKGTVVRIPQKFIKKTKKMPFTHRVTQAPKNT